MKGQPRQMGLGGEFWQNVVCWRRKWQTTSAFLPWEPQEQYEKAKRYMLLEKSGEIAPERMKKERKIKSLSHVQLLVTPWSLPGSSVHGIFQVKVLEWVVISFSRGSSWPRDQTGVSCIVGRHFPVWAMRAETKERMKRLMQKQKQHPVVDVTGDESKVWCCKEQYYKGTWNVRSMNQGKLEVVKQGMARVNINILGISEPKWTWIGKFNSEDHYIYNCDQESLWRNGVALTVNQRIQNALLGCSLKNDRMISVCSQGKPFNITVILWTGKSGTLQSMGPQKSRTQLSDWTELNWKMHASFPWQRLMTLLPVLSFH